MQNESTIDPKIIEEVLKFSRNVIEAPKFVSAPDEINLEVTSHKVVQHSNTHRRRGTSLENRLTDHKISCTSF